MRVDLFEPWKRYRLTIKEAIPTLLGVSGFLIMVYDFSTTETFPNAIPQHREMREPTLMSKLIDRRYSSSEVVPTANENLPKELVQLRPKIFSEASRNFSSKFKNPCYFDKIKKLHCLPYFFLIGAPKCGTTDVWSKITYHPHIECIRKEPHWWTRLSLKNGTDTLNDYEDLFFNHAVQRLMNKKVSASKAITGDGSASTLWDNKGWEQVYPKHAQVGPPYIVADVIRHVLPKAKLIVSFREPIARLYSEYHAFRPKEQKSPEDFHSKVVAEIANFSSCLNERSLRSCAYRKPRYTTVRLNVGLYSLYVNEWLQRYPRKQMMFLTLEDWQKRCPKLLPKLFKFLSVGFCIRENHRDDRLGQSLVMHYMSLHFTYKLDRQSPTKAKLSTKAIQSSCSRKGKNVNPVERLPMLNLTRTLLREFYQPYVGELAVLLRRKKFRWDYGDDQENHV